MRFAWLIALVLVPVARADDVDYVRDVRPILQAKCAACHGAVRQKAGLRLDAAQLALKGTKRGPVIIPDNAAESALIEAVSGKDRPRMPPEGEGEHLSEKDIATLRAWINQGAKAPEEPVPTDPKSHWAYQPIKRPNIPVSREAKPSANAIDAFLAAEWGKHRLKPNPPADKATLLRRVYLDLIGLPPTRDELHAFLKDDSPDAYEKVVEKLLASPAYGERWGRHWMDVWRYSDPFGFNDEYRYSQRHIWRWRDWIIESLNADKGYDRMIVEMLAGDEIAPADRDTLRATGYLARNWYKFNRTAWIQDTTEYTAAGFLGVTLKCARCHDHKYDPISQKDYYQFRAFFEPHDIRIDALPGQPDTTKDGVARAYDAKPDSPTYLFVRGDERMPDKSRALSPGVPGILGGELTVQTVKFSPNDFAATLPATVAELRLLSKMDCEAADGAVKRATASVASARQLLDDIAAGRKPGGEGLTPYFHDTFAKRSDAWTVASGPWAWEGGKLVCKSPSNFATVTTKTNHPANLAGRVRFRPTGGGIGSVGFSYDAADSGFQAVYVNAAMDPAVRAFHRVKGADTYPPAGVVPHPVKFGDEVTLDFAVRGDLLNTWVNGTLRNVYRLPVPRQAGVFQIWTFDATAEILEVRLAGLPDAVPLAEKPGDTTPSPIGTAPLTMADAEAALKGASESLKRAEKRQEATRAVFDALEARLAAEQTKFAEPVDTAKLKALSLAAGKAEHRVALLKADDALNASAGWAKLRAWVAFAKATRDYEKDDPTYTPLVKMDPAGSTGRRLALAKWITNRRNPLTARVAVNHIWLRHFGKPLVASVANYGLSGQKPTHPELFDWLAAEFMDSGWSMKMLHRLIVTSNAYRLSSAPNKQDAENKFYTRANPRRMEAEVVRDSVLAVAGLLDRTMGGPILSEKQGQTVLRRSVYFRFNTEYKMQFLDQFDAASPTECYERRESVIPQQALALHNSALTLNMARHLAKQLAKEGDFLTAAFETVLGRAPTADERTRCEAFLREQAELFKDPKKLTAFPPGPDAVTPPATDPVQRAREDLIHVLLNHNDFVTIR